MKTRKVIGAVILVIVLFNISAPTVLSQTAQLPPTQCFKQEECGQGKYKNSFAVQAPECAPYPPYTHYCVSNPPAVKLSIPLDGKDEIQGLQNYIATLYKFLIGIVGILAGVMIILAGFQWLTAAGDSGKIKAARGKIFNALIGLVLALGAYTILYTVNPALLSLQLAPIKILREETIASSVWSECNNNQDCLPLQSRQVMCGIIKDDQTTLTIPRICQPKLPGSNTTQFSGTCVITAGQTCRIESYSCTNFLQTGFLAAGTAAVLATGGGAAIGAASGIGAGTGALMGASAIGGTGLAGVTSTGAIVKSVVAIGSSAVDLAIDGVTEKTSSGGFDASFACQKGTFCKLTGKFKDAQDSLTTDPNRYTCQPTEPNAICRDDTQCPNGYHCIQKTTGDIGICLALTKYHTKEIGQACVYQQECKTDRCVAGVCGKKGIEQTGADKRPSGSDCTENADCQGGFCIGFERNSSEPTDCNVLCTAAILTPNCLQLCTTVERAQPAQGQAIDGVCQPTAKDPRQQNLNKITAGGICETSIQCITGTTCQQTSPSGVGIIIKQCK